MAIDGFGLVLLCKTKTLGHDNIVAIARDFSPNPFFLQLLECDGPGSSGNSSSDVPFTYL